MKKARQLIVLTLLLILTACNQEEEKIDQFILLERSNAMISDADSFHASFTQDLLVSTFGFGSVVNLEGDVLIKRNTTTQPRMKSNISAHYMDVSNYTISFFAEAVPTVINETTGQTRQELTTYEAAYDGMLSNLVDTHLMHDEIISSYFIELPDGYELTFILNNDALIRQLGAIGEVVEEKNIRSGRFQIKISLDENLQQTDVMLQIEVTHFRERIGLESINLSMRSQILQLNDVEISLPSG